jgi:soluble lytic murein transglycosylase-like protein
VTVQYKEVTGWAARDQLGAPIAPEEETLPEQAAVDTMTPRPGSGVAFTTVDLSLRAGPSATETPLAAVPAGSRVILTGVMESGFQRVEFRDQLGWIAAEFLSTPADPEPEGGRRKGTHQNYSRQQIVRIIYDAADRYDQDRDDMLRVAECESNLDPYAVNPSGSYGLFQFIRSTWRSTPFGGEDIFDPRANANAAGWMWAEGRKSEWVCQ